MRVAFVGTRGVPASYSGFETCVEEVGRRMVAGGHDVTVFCRASHYEHRPVEYLGMRLVYRPAIRQKHLETISHTAASILRLPRDTAVVCMGVGNAPVVRLLELRGRQTVFNVDGADWQRKKWGGFARRYLRMCEGLAARGRSILIADAHAVQRYYRELFDRATEYVPYGADPPRDGGLEALRKFGLQPGGYGLFVGRLVPENAPHDLLAGVVEARLPLTTVIVGDATYAGDYIARLKDEAPSGTVFTGFQFGTPYQQLSTHARLFVLAATVGGTHPVLVEQMAAGNCILARETESNHEVLGDAGLYWRTPAELAALLRSIWDDDSRRQTLGDAARDRARELYDWDRVTERYLELCRRTLAATRRASVPQG